MVLLASQGPQQCEMPVALSLDRDREESPIVPALARRPLHFLQLFLPCCVGLEAVLQHYLVGVLYRKGPCEVGVAVLGVALYPGGSRPSCSQHNVFSLPQDKASV